MNGTDAVDIVYLMIKLSVNVWFKLNFPLIGTYLSVHLLTP